jgi:hypothetical protein
VLDLPLEILTSVCQQLDLHDLVRVAETCKRLRHGDGGMETLRLPTKSPVVAVLREHAFPRLQSIRRTRSIGCSESWVTYLARCARQRRCREASPIAAGDEHSLFVDGAGRLLACGNSLVQQRVTVMRTPVSPTQPRWPAWPGPSPGGQHGRNSGAERGGRTWPRLHRISTAWPPPEMAGSTRGAATALGSWGKETGWAKETGAPSLLRHWWRDSRACVASPLPVTTVWP